MVEADEVAASGLAIAARDVVSCVRCFHLIPNGASSEMRNLLHSLQNKRVFKAITICGTLDHLCLGVLRITSPGWR